MNRFTLLLILILCQLSLAGCAKENPEDRLPGAYDEALEKAESVEQTLQDATEERMKGLEESN